LVSNPEVFSLKNLKPARGVGQDYNLPRVHHCLKVAVGKKYKTKKDKRKKRKQQKVKK
jgi:hypothetical protein